MITSGPGTRVLKEATTTIPIVMAAAGDAVATGLVASLARPGRNITGSTSFGPELSAKRLEMLMDFNLVKKTATLLNVELLEVPARSPREFDDAFALMLRRQADGLVLLSDSVFVAKMRRLGELSTAKRLPGAGSDEYAQGGGLLAYGVNFPELWRRAPYFVDRILKGGKPAAIPVEQASRFELVFNLKSARTLGLPIPQSLLLRADHVIE